MKKLIKFLFKSYDQLFIAFGTLRQRYKIVTLERYYYNGWWYGYFEVEGIKQNRLNYQ